MTAVRKAAIGKHDKPTHGACQSRISICGFAMLSCEGDRDNRHRGRGAGLLPARLNWMKNMTLTSRISAAPGPAVISAMIVGAAIAALGVIILVPTAKKKNLCDQVVSTLFTTTDAIELQRAMFLIRRLDCKISMRL
jgi:hypothetical protein